MADLSGLSDAELARAAGVTLPVKLYMPESEQERAAAIRDVFEPTQSQDLTAISTEELMRAAGISAQPAQAPVAPTPDKAGFLDRVGTDLGKRWAEGQDAARAFAEGKISTPELILASTGKVVAGSANDIIGEGISSIGSGVAAVTPDAIKKPIARAANSFLETDIARAGLDAIKGGAEMYRGWAAKNPRAARNLESTVNVAALLPLAKASEPIAAGAATASEAAGGVVSKAGNVIVKSADARSAAKKTDFIQELVTPKLTPTVKADLFSRSVEKGLGRKRVVVPNAQESAIIDAVKELPVSARKSQLANYNVIAEANQKEAQNLIAEIAKNNAKISTAQIDQALNNSLDTLKKSPFITGDAETAANRVITGFRDILAKNNDYTASGLLKSRKDFDAWVKSQKGAGIFDPARDSPVSMAVQNVRQTVNDLVANAVPQAKVKQSLRKQSNLYRAMDNIETKGGYEAPTALKRLAQKAAETIPGKTAVTKSALAAGGLGAAAYAPALVGSGLVAYGTGKALASPALQKGLGMLLQGAGSVMQGKSPVRIGLKRITQQTP